MKSITLISILVLYSVVVYSGISQDELDKKLCDSSLSDAKLAELEKCDRFSPQEFTNISIQCLKQMDKGIEFKDSLKVYCDLSTKKKYNDCQMEIVKKNMVEIMSKNYNLTQIYQNINDCVKSVLNIQNVQEF